MTCSMAMIAVVTTIVDFHWLILDHEVCVYNYNNKLCEVTYSSKSYSCSLHNTVSSVNALIHPLLYLYDIHIYILI